MPFVHEADLPVADPPGVPDRAAAARLALGRLRDGDVGALDILYHAYAASLLQIATRLLGSRSDAEDVVHDVFVSAARAASALRDDTDAGAWLRTLTINRCIDRNRATARHAELSHYMATMSTAPDDTPDVVAAERIEQAVAALPSNLRTVFVLRAVEGHSHVEIARMLMARVGCSEVRYHRAIRALRATLGDLR